MPLLRVQVYEVTIFEAEDEDSFDEDTEITEAVSQTHTQNKHKYTLVVVVVVMKVWLCVCFSLRTTGGAPSVTSWILLFPETVSAAGRCALIGCRRILQNPTPPVPKPCPRSRPTNQKPKKLQVCSCIYEELLRSFQKDFLKILQSVLSHCCQSPELLHKLVLIDWLVLFWRIWCRGERRSRCSGWEKSQNSHPVTMPEWLRPLRSWLLLLGSFLPGSPHLLPAFLLLLLLLLLSAEALDCWLPAIFLLLLLHRLPGASPIFPHRSPSEFATTSSTCPRSGAQRVGSSSHHPRSGAQRVGGVASAGVVPGPVSHLSVPAEERLHRPRTDRTPHSLLRLRQEAEEEEQAVSGVQAADSVGHPHLRQLRRTVSPHTAETCVTD